MPSYHADHAWLESGLHAQVRLEVDVDGRIQAVHTETPAQPGDVALGPLLLPAIPNAHSHAFQRLIAGCTEYQSDPADDFWSWREAMYACAQRLTPDDLYTVACHAYREMQVAGYGQVCEFHYLHAAESADGPLRMAEALIAAAAHTGIALTLLPVLYQQGGFDGRPLSARQQRFGLSTQRYLELLATLRAREHARLRVGIAVHSLRAVSPSALREVLAHPLAAVGPIHIHIAEQTAEVDQCRAAYGTTPIRWLYDHAQVDARWHLVHATHADAEEIALLARSGASVVLCPSTEANLGDGVFALTDFLQAGGSLSIGSDSHVVLDPFAELELAEYGQRLWARARNRCASATQPAVAQRLLQAVLAGGRGAAGMECGRLQVGASADWLVLTPAPGFQEDAGARQLDSRVFAQPRGTLQAWCQGQPVQAADGRGFARLRSTLVSP